MKKPEWKCVREPDDRERRELTGTGFHCPPELEELSMEAGETIRGGQNLFYWVAYLTGSLFGGAVSGTPDSGQRAYISALH